MNTYTPIQFSNLNGFHRTLPKPETKQFPQPLQFVARDGDQWPGVASGGYYYHRDGLEQQSRKRAEDNRQLLLTIKRNQEIELAPHRSHLHVGEGTFKNQMYERANAWYQPPPLLSHAALPGPIPL